MAIQTVSAEMHRTIESHGFNVTTADGIFVLRDPGNPSAEKLEGLDLSALINSALAARGEDETVAAPAPRRRRERVERSSRVQEPPEPAPVRQRSPEPPVRHADTGRMAKPKQRRERATRSPLEWTTGRIGILIIKNPNRTEDEIFALATKAGIKTTRLTVVGLNRYFNLYRKCEEAIAAEGKKK